MQLSEERQFALSHLHIRRKSTQMSAGILIALLLSIALNFISVCSLNSLEEALTRDISVVSQSQAQSVAPESLNPTFQEISEARTRLLIVGALLFAAVSFTAYRMMTVGPRVVAQEFWIRRMGDGDLDYKLDTSGSDEIAESSRALEKLRQRSIRVVRLNLVEKLSQDLQTKNEELEGVLEELRLRQEQAIFQQKLVELGELTAGVAHEIRNPLNFIENFAESSEELLEDLKVSLNEAASVMAEGTREYIDEISQDIAYNMSRIRVHGDRADRIIRDMLSLGRDGGDFELTGINSLLREHALLAYRSVHALDNDFQLDIRENLDPSVGNVSVIPEDISRVFLNIVGNACYATGEKSRMLEDRGVEYAPTLWLTTERREDTIEISIRDNGGGIPDDVIDRIFNPFFTTKPTNRGTGLGLSLSNDIIRGHGGTITATSEVGEYTEMTISLPA